MFPQIPSKTYDTTITLNTFQTPPQSPSSASSPAAQPPSMAATLFTSRITVHYNHSLIPILSPTPKLGRNSLPQNSVSKIYNLTELRRKSPVCFVLKDEQIGEIEEDVIDPTAARVAEKVARKKSERVTYLIAAVMSSFGISSMAILAVYSRFYWQMEGGEVPYAEMFCTFALAIGAAVGMEFWARWAHRALWHASLWNMHESHHKPREGPFELNDIFAIINAAPAIALLYYGSLYKGIVPGLCFGAGLGITVFGMAYMFVHDGLVHKRFPVGPIADVPYLRKVASAHQLHHSEKFDGVPYGLFLGPKELEEVGGLEELDKEISRRIQLYKNSDKS